MAVPNNVHGHTGRDAVIGGLVGHEGHQGHTGRDAVIGGMTGHVAKDHRQHNAEVGKPGIGDKISGGVDKLIGKATNNPTKVAEGQAKTGTV